MINMEMTIDSKALLLTGEQSARLLLKDSIDTVSGQLIITAQNLYFREFVSGNMILSAFNLGGERPPKVCQYHIASDILSVDVITISDKEFRKTHQNYKCANAVNIFKQPKACIRIVLRTQEPVIFCVLPQNDHLRQDDYVRGLAGLIKNIANEKVPNTNIPCKCCGKILSYPQNFCELCGTPIHIVKRIAAKDGFARTLKISLIEGRSVNIRTDRGDNFTLANVQWGDIVKPKTQIEMKAYSPKMVLFVTKADYVKRLEVGMTGDGELFVGEHAPIGCSGNIQIIKEENAPPRFLFFGESAAQPPKPYPDQDNILLVDP
jgi:hypothetical protein